MRDGPAHWLIHAVTAQGLAADDVVLDDLPVDGPLEVVWQALAERLGISEHGIAEAVAGVFRVRVADLSKAQPTAVKLLPASVARKFGVFPLEDRNRHLVVATANPCDADAEREVGFASGRHAEFVVAPPKEILEAIDLAYAPDRAVDGVLDRLGVLEDVELEVLEEEEDPEPEADAELLSGPAVRLANAVLSDAIGRGASDIHIQPTVTGGMIRFRVDGVLTTVVQFPEAVLNRLISRLKIMGRMDIADRIRPQDGRAQVAHAGARYDLRISSVPVRGHEKMVIRILDPNQIRGLEETSLEPCDLERLRGLLNARNGIVVVTGPTGSGKTTTLYGALREIATDEVNIMTVEDPVEYELPGLAQIQVSGKKGVTFASALRAILRQDPDVIFIGEIRDEETAHIAAQASLTGHLVLATVHANDAVGSIRRFRDLGLDTSTVAQTLRGAVAQRLVRRLCPECAEPTEGRYSEEERTLAEVYGVEPPMRATGCTTCHEAGYLGRLPIAEIMFMSAAMEGMVVNETTPTEVHRQAVRDGMRPLRQAALERVRQGVTTLQEVHRVLGDGESDDEVAAEVQVPAAEAQAPPAEAQVPAAAAVSGKVPSPSAEITPDTPPVVAPTPETSASGERPAIRGIDVEEDAVPPRAMVVDDDPVNRAVVRALLQRDRFEVQEAADGGEALAHLTADPEVNLMILDLEMPGIDGREVLQHMRSTPPTAGVPVIVLTGRTGPEWESALLQDGADDYLTKPVDPVRFSARVRATLRRARG
jgi:type II secretory ATPase GspE/PulE/Tfp pilus assembly ATPase PilB-like protein/ActR/RegA family two-component response regulator